MPAEEIHAACDRPGSTRDTLRVLGVVCDEVNFDGLITVSGKRINRTARAEPSASISSGAPN
jgi:hypothetical protein